MNASAPRRLTDAERQRRRRRRAREGRMMVRFEAWPELIDALETAGYAPAGIETAADAAAAITRALSLWETSVDRLKPQRFEAVTRDGTGGAGALETAISDSQERENP